MAPEHAQLRLDFGWALRRLREGMKVTREGWNGRGMWLALQVPDEHSKMTRPYIYMSTADGALVPWVASQSDIFGEDWLCASPDGVITWADGTTV